MALQDGQATRDNWVLEPKHKVFLSHSGSQKAFVEQLDVDLRRCDRYPFFDKDRDSLPIGEPFPAHIFEAIGHCHVGVVVLSEEFLSSKWPMVELVEMVRTIERRPGQLRLIPIFLSISCADLGDKKKLRGWKDKWAKFDKRPSISEFESALKLLKKTNGLVFDPGVGEVKFREDIVKNICSIVPPFHRWDDSHVQGRLRLSKAIVEKIEEIPKSQRYGIQVVGLYGVGGIGKTTSCKSLYNDLFMKFEGRVCHLEFGNDSSEKERLLEALKRLTDSNSEVLEDLKVDGMWSRLNNLMKKEKVFLAIDNASDDKSIDEAKKYLEAGYCSGSIVMVTARALDVLKYLKIDDSNCLEMPELEEDEARSLFLYHAKPQTEVNEEVLMHCVNRCYFSKGMDGICHYHPLALKVLDSQLATTDSEEWEMQLKEVDVFNLRRERENPVFSILRRSFDELMDEDKMMFMDVVLFDTQDEYKTWREDFGFSHYERCWFIFEWLSMVHGKSVTDVKKQLQGLKKKALLEELGNGSTQIGMHDLWREFGVMESIQGELESRRWVHEILEGGVVESILSAGGWKQVQRISVRRGMDGTWKRSCESSVECLNFSDCSKATVLKLVDVDVENNVLDLSALKRLKCLEIIYNFDGMHSSKTSPVVSGIGLLTNLKVLIWLGISVESMSAVEEISCLKLLQVLQLTCYMEDVSARLDLSQLRLLREMRIDFRGELTIVGLSSEMTNFRILDLAGCERLRDCLGVDKVIGLELLVLNGCEELEKLPDLSNLSRLRVFDVRNCTSLRHVSGVGNLIALQEFYGSGPFLEDLPDRGNLSKLQKAEIFGWNEVQDSCVLPSPENDEFNPQEPSSLNVAIVKSVSTLHVTESRYELSNLGKLTSLQELTISDCRVMSLSGLGCATALRRIWLYDVILERLPDMGKDMRLESLQISGCSRLTGWDGVDSSESENRVVLQCSWTLPYLEVLCLYDSAVFQIPDLSHFPRLKKLWISHPLFDCSSKFSLRCLSNHLQLESLELSYSPIKELPDLSIFPCLKDIYLNYCENLSRLSSSRLLTALKTLQLRGCKNLEVLPDVDHFPSLRSVFIAVSYVKLDMRLVENLRARARRGRLDEEGSSSEQKSDALATNYISRFSGDKTSPCDEAIPHDEGFSFNESIHDSWDDTWAENLRARARRGRLDEEGSSSKQKSDPLGTNYVSPYSGDEAICHDEAIPHDEGYACNESIHDSWDDTWVEYLQLLG